VHGHQYQKHRHHFSEHYAFSRKTLFPLIHLQHKRSQRRSRLLKIVIHRLQPLIIENTALVRDLSDDDIHILARPVVDRDELHLFCSGDDHIQKCRESIGYIVEVATI
jgi:hypothetical protein